MTFLFWTRGYNLRLEQYRGQGLVMFRHKMCWVKVLKTHIFAGTPKAFTATNENKQNLNSLVINNTHSN